MFNPDIHHRQSTRLREYDYAGAGAYFVTVCVHERECLFGDIREDTMRLNEAGRIVESIWQAVPKRFPNVRLDEFRIMPNHFHGIIVITDVVGALLAAPDISSSDSKQGAASSAPTLGKIMRMFKSISAIQVNLVLDRQGQPLWQRNYYERIVRDEEELATIREYIIANPMQWAEDKENPDVT